MSPKTLITGAAGFAGGYLVDLVAAGGGDVVAWRHTNGRALSEAPNLKWDSVDLLDRQRVGDAIARVRPERVYHCAGKAHVGRAWENTESTFAVNLRGTHNLLDALEATGAPARVLIPSSALVYADAHRPLTEDDPLVPASPYGVSKLAQELLAHHAHGGVRVMIARAFNHFGPRQDPMFVASGFARRIADIEHGRWAPEISVGNLEAKRDLTDVRDTVRAYRMVLEHGDPERAYNVCSGTAIVIRDLLDMMIARAGVPVTISQDPSRIRPNDVPLLVGDPGRIRRELGWAASIPIERTVDDLLEYWRTRGS